MASKGGLAAKPKPSDVAGAIARLLPAKYIMQSMQSSNILLILHTSDYNHPSARRTWLFCFLMLEALCFTSKIKPFPEEQ